jgi:hypothetical protein
MNISHAVEAVGRGERAWKILCHIENVVAEEGERQGKMHFKGR